jgi:hypothetical protein
MRLKEKMECIEQYLLKVHHNHETPENIPSSGLTSTQKMEESFPQDDKPSSIIEPPPKSEKAKGSSSDPPLLLEEDDVIDTLSEDEDWSDNPLKKKSSREVTRKTSKAKKRYSVNALNSILIKKSAPLLMSVLLSAENPQKRCKLRKI